MRPLILMLTLAVAIGCLVSATPSWATDTDGPHDCSKDPMEDWGDAPEGVPAYPGGVIGNFPTCRDMTLHGTQDLPPFCNPISAPPGPTGHIFHRQGINFSRPLYWIGCHLDDSGAEMGIDRDPEGKVNSPAVGFSFCDHGPTDCAENAYGMTFDQDECYGDGSDAGLDGPPELIACEQASLTFTTFNCDSFPRQVILNILIDMNHDGDWNDAQTCDTTCVYEWAVKNATITLPPGCGKVTSPSFQVGPKPGPSWLRLSIMNERVQNDFPWAGAAGHSGFTGGETEDYPATIQQAVPTKASSWGKVKASYR